MTAPILHVESDFDSPNETLEDWHHRTHPVVERAFPALIAFAFAVAFLLALAAFGSLAAYG